MNDLCKKAFQFRFFSEGPTSALLLLGWFASELVFILSMVCFLTQRKGIESHFQRYISKRRKLGGSKDLIDWDRVRIGKRKNACFNAI